MLRRMLRLLAVPAFLAVAVSARDKSDTWIQITSPHFVVATNGSEKQGRRVADQFERMRSLFHALFPKAQVDPGTPIVVLAPKDEKSFRALEPQDYLAKGSLKLGGLFLRAPDKNYVLMRLDAEGDHPYAVIYHEYTHLVMSKSEDFLPLWVNEGLAQFYQNTEINEKEASLGQASRDNILLLRENKLLPLPTLFTVDHNSPYYHEENKGSIFYAESWALTHYLENTDFTAKTHRMSDYLTLLTQQVDPVTAGTRAFGDLKLLQQELEKYIHQTSGFRYFKIVTKTEVDDSAFKMQALTEPQSDALRADFLAYNRRTADAQALLDHVLQEDPKNVSAHETKGFLEFQQGHLNEAKKWYAQAVQLDSQSYLAHYYFSAISLLRLDESDPEQIESSLRAAIKLNPQFAPAFDALAVFLGRRKKSLEEARLMELTAIGLEPANIAYRINISNVYMAMEKGQAAVDVLRATAKLAKNPQESQMVGSALMQAQQFAESEARYAEETRQMTAEQKAGASPGTAVSTTASGSVPHLARRPAFVARGPHHFLVGVLKSVHCDNPGLDLTVDADGKLVAMHVENYFKLPFTSLGFQPDKDLNPCSDLENRPAKVEYVESANPSVTAQVISVELHK
jgi:tetratricopeptide (TPR) repeat protein